MAKKDDGEGEASEGCGPDEAEGCQAIPFGAQVAGVPLAKDLCLLRDGGWSQIKGVRGDIVLEGRRPLRRKQERGMGTYIVADTVITRPVSQHRSVPQHEFLPIGISLGLKILHEPWQC